MDEAEEVTITPGQKARVARATAIAEEQLRQAMHLADGVGAELGIDPSTPVVLALVQVIALNYNSLTIASK